MIRMRKFYAFLFVCLFLFALLLFFHDVLFVLFLKQALSRAGFEFSCKKVSFENGRLQLLDFVIEEPNLKLKASRGELGFSWRERGFEVFLAQVEGYYVPSSTKSSFTPPRYLAALYLNEGNFLFGKPPLKVEIDRLALRKLGSFWREWRVREALAGTTSSPSPKPEVGKELSLPARTKPSKEAIQVEVKADLSRLPPGIRKKLSVEKGFLKIDLGLTPQGEERFPFEGSLKLQGVSFVREGKRHSLTGASNFSGLWEQKNGRFVLDGHGTLDLPLRFSYRLKGVWKEEKKEVSEASLRFRAPLEAFSPFVGYRLRGDLRGTLEAKPAPGNFSLSFVLDKGGFELSEERVGEGFSLKGEVSGTYREGLFLRGQTLVDKGEIFWAPWYYALSKPLKLSFSGAFQRNSFSFDNLEIKGPFEAVVKGLRVYPSVSWPDEGRLSLVVEDFWQPLVAEPFGEDHPILREISPRGKLELQEKKQKFGASFRGEIDFKDHRFEGLSFTAGYDLSGACEGFSFSWREVRGPFFEASALDLRGKTCPPKVSLDPFGFSLLDGELSAAGGRGNLEEKFFVLKRLLLEDLKPRLPEPWDSLSPRVSGRFEEILFQKGLVKGRGLLEIELARGKILVRDPFFAPGILPRYGGEVEFFGLDLAELSRALGLGLITGRLRGRIKNLVMVGKLPESFELWLEDDPSYQGSKRISLKAVRQISELGGGSATIFVPFVKNLRYQRLGIYCRLQNNVFYLRGLIRKGEREYLLKGPKLFGVDVINQNPGGAISFKEMLRRLKRILEEENENTSQSISQPFDPFALFLCHHQHLLPGRGGGEGRPGDKRRGEGA